MNGETVRRWIKSGKLAAVILPSGQARIRRETLDAILQERIAEPAERSA